jgi:hypothetical protein
MQPVAKAVAKVLVASCALKHVYIVSEPNKALKRLGGMTTLKLF